MVIDYTDSTTAFQQILIKEITRQSKPTIKWDYADRNCKLYLARI